MCKTQSVVLLQVTANRIMTCLIKVFFWFRLDASGGQVRLVNLGNTPLDRRSPLNMPSVSVFLILMQSDYEYYFLDSMN